VDCLKKPSRSDHSPSHSPGPPGGQSLPPNPQSTISNQQSEISSSSSIQHSAFKIQNFSGGAFAEVFEQFGPPDIVHDHGVWLPFHKEIAAECVRAGIPRIVSPRGMLEPWALNHKKWKKKLAWWLYQRRDLQSAAALHATAESEAEQLRKLGFKQRIILAPNGVAVPQAPNVECWMLNDELNSTEHEATAEPEISSIQNSKFKIQNCPRTALFLSRVHPKKGLPMLLEAWARLRPEGWQLRIVGPDEGGHVEELKRLCGKLGLRFGDASNVEHRTSNVELRREENGDSLASRADGDKWDACGETSLPGVEFSRPLDGEEKWRAFREADLFVLPTYSENFGIAVAEALACGVPVITTTGAPWAGLLEHHCGWWVEPETDAIGKALEEGIALSDEERRAMGARGAEWVREEFAWEGIARKVVEGYGAVGADQRIRPTCRHRREM
jgi:glycosyltransferase involved in cell wall biosynthesis